MSILDLRHINVRTVMKKGGHIRFCICDSDDNFQFLGKLHLDGESPLITLLLERRPLAREVLFFGKNGLPDIKKSAFVRLHSGDFLIK